MGEPGPFVHDWPLSSRLNLLPRGLERIIFSIADLPLFRFLPCQQTLASNRGKSQEVYPRLHLIVLDYSVLFLLASSNTDISKLSEEKPEAERAYSKFTLILSALCLLTQHCES